MPITYDDIKDLSESIPALSARRLMPTWAYIQSIKYDGMLNDGDCGQPNIIFMSCELPLIKRIYSEETVNPKLRKLMSGLLKKTKEYSKLKFERYLELRRYGMSIERARKEIEPIHSERFLIRMALKFNQPIAFHYGLECRDADLLYNMGLDRFLDLFYDRFITTNFKKQHATGNQRAGVLQQEDKVGDR